MCVPAEQLGSALRAGAAGSNAAVLCRLAGKRSTTASVRWRALQTVRNGAEAISIEECILTKLVCCTYVRFNACWAICHNWLSIPLIGIIDKNLLIHFLC